GPQKLGIPHLDGASPRRRHSLEKRCKRLHESCRVLDSPPAQRAELEDQNAHPFPVWLERLKERTLEQIPIEKQRIVLPCQRSVPRVRGPARNRHLLRNLQSPPKSRRRPAEQLRPEFSCRKLIKRKIAANGGKHVRIFGNTRLFKQLFGESPANLIVRARINLTQPPFVFPRAATDANAARRKRTQPVAQTLPVKRNRLIQIEQRVQL